jgi:hypothetical protein
MVSPWAIPNDPRIALSNMDMVFPNKRRQEKGKTSNPELEPEEPPPPQDEDLEDAPPFIRCPGGYRGGPPE